MANEFAGTSFIGLWTTSAATVTLNTDYRNFAYTPSISFIDAAAGADVTPTRLSYMKDGAVAVTMLMPDNVASATLASFNEGQIGTLTWGEAGTAAGKPKVTLPAISQGATRTSPYNDVVTLSVNWLQNGARVDGTY